MFRLGIFLSVAVIILLGPAHSAASEPRFGIWVEAEGQNQPFTTKENFEKLLAFIDQGNFTDVYCQVYRGGRTWFPSRLGDEAPYRSALAQGFDPLGELIRRAHARGRKVHAWLNVLRVESPTAPIIEKFGEEVVLRDRYGHSLLSYSPEGIPPGRLGGAFKLDTPGIWLDPASGHVRSYTLGVVAELLDAYPALDGVHMDMVRYPFAMANGSHRGGFAALDFGYGIGSIQAFEEAQELPHLASVLRVRGKRRYYTDRSVPSGAAWTEWRRKQLTRLVFEVRELLNRRKQRKELSAAVLASIPRAHDRALQNWQGWLRGGLINTAVPMAYTSERSAAAALSEAALVDAPPGSVLIGLGGWLLLDRSSALAEQAADALAAGAPGVVVFSYSNLVNERGKMAIARARDVVLGKRERPSGGAKRAR